MKTLSSQAVATPIFGFLQLAFAGANAPAASFERTHAETLLSRISSGSPMSIKEALSLPGGEKRALKELLTQYVMFFTMFDDLTFPPDFLNGTDETRLGSAVLGYVANHQWPFPQQLPWIENS